MNLRNVHLTMVILMSEQSFAELIKRAQSGCRESLGRLLNSYQRYLLSIARTELGPGLRAKCDPSDLVQETFLDAYRDFAAFRGESYHDLLKWLRNILKHNFSDFCRSYCTAKCRHIAREERLSELHDLSGFSNTGSTPTWELIGREEADQLEQALTRLPENYRKVIELRNRDHMPLAEIGKRMKRTPDAVRMLWTRALERLQNELARSP